MPTSDCLQAYRESLLDLAWSLWSELGVAGLARRHGHWAMDPEELLVFTAWLGDRDARLRDECADWCCRAGDALSVDRLKNLLAEGDEATRAGFGELASLVRVGKGPKLPGASATTRAFSPSGKSRRPDCRRPAALIFRLRSLVGIGARAELLAHFLLEPARWFSVSDLIAEGVGFARVTVSKALEPLAEAGVVEQDAGGREGRHRLARRPGLVETLDLPLAWRPSWGRVFALLKRGDEALARPLARDARVAALDAAADAAALAALAADLRMHVPVGGGLSVPLGAAHLGLAADVAGSFADPSVRREDTATWLCTTAASLAAGHYPGPAAPARLESEDFFAFVSLRAVRSRVTGEVGHRPEYGSDDVLRALASRRPATPDEVAMVSDPAVPLAPAVVDLYLDELRRLPQRPSRSRP